MQDHSENRPPVNLRGSATYGRAENRAAKHPIIDLDGAVQHYDWGGHRFIPEMLGISDQAGQPHAELWIGAHPKAPAAAIAGRNTVPLDRLISEAAETILGPAVATRFQGRLPYLMKVVDSRRMLSVQVHPGKERARQGYSLENAAGIDLRDPRRNYRDDDHKPEVQVALTEMWMLHGLRPLEEIAGYCSAHRN